MANSGETQTHVPALRWAILKNKQIPPFLMSASLMLTLKQVMAAAKGKFASITLLIINMNSFKDTAIGYLPQHKPRLKLHINHKNPRDTARFNILDCPMAAAKRYSRMHGNT